MFITVPHWNSTQLAVRDKDLVGGAQLIGRKISDHDGKSGAFGLFDNEAPHDPGDAAALQ